MTMTTTESLRQHQLVILRRLRDHPLTEFELAAEVAESSSHDSETCADRMQEWLQELREEGLIWAGSLLNSHGQSIMAAALTTEGRKIAC